MVYFDNLRGLAMCIGLTVCRDCIVRVLAFASLICPAAERQCQRSCRLALQAVGGVVTQQIAACSMGARTHTHPTDKQTNKNSPSMATLRFSHVCHFCHFL